LNNQGFLVAISSPSGGGKSTVIKRLLKKGNLPYIYSVSMTTRSPRPSEIDGKDYWFISKDKFKRLIDEGEFIEYEKVHDNLYGTPISPIRNWINEKKIVLLDVDVYGALNLKKDFPNDSLLIFLKAPNKQELIKRLSGRKTETDQQIARRLERVEQELAEENNFDEIVVNNILDDTVSTVENLVKEFKIKPLQGGK
jgi:guanylate kinase